MNGMNTPSPYLRSTRRCQREWRSRSASAQPCRTSRSETARRLRSGESRAERDRAWPGGDTQAWSAPFRETHPDERRASRWFDAPADVRAGPPRRTRTVSYAHCYKRIECAPGTTFRFHRLRDRFFTVAKCRTAAARGPNGWSVTRGLATSPRTRAIDRTPEAASRARTPRRGIGGDGASGVRGSPDGASFQARAWGLARKCRQESTPCWGMQALQSRRLSSGAKTSPQPH